LLSATQAWLAGHPRTVIAAVLLVCLGPFLNQAVQTDDALFVWTAQWIQKHPVDFFGSRVNWWFTALPMWLANYNPPLFPYFLAAVATVFGWSDLAMHLGCLVLALTAAMGIHALAQTCCQRPLLATLIAILTPAFLVSSTTLMCDVPMLTCWIWAMVLWDRALRNEASRWLFVGAGTLAGMALLTKYSVVTLLPLLPLLCVLRNPTVPGVLRNPRLGWWLLGLAVPLLILAGFEVATTKLYGHGLFQGAVQYAHRNHIGFPGGWKASLIVNLAFTGGCLLPLLFFAPLLWRLPGFLAGTVLIFGALFATFSLSHNLGLAPPPTELPKTWGFQLQAIFMAAGGLFLVLLIATEIPRWREPNSTLLILWLISGLLFATVLNWTVNARSFLPIVPAVAILIARRIEALRGNSLKSAWLLLPLVPAAVATLYIATANYQLANTGRTAATEMIAKFKTADHQLWFEGHGGFQYYMERMDCQPIDVEHSILKPGDIVVVPEIGIRTPLPLSSVGWVEHEHFVPTLPLVLTGTTGNASAGFYGANMGPLPFCLGDLPEQNYFVVRVYASVKYVSKPRDPTVIKNGDIPGYDQIANQVDDQTTFPQTQEAVDEIKLGQQLEQEGKVEDALKHYREAVRLNPEHPFFLNNLARVLATTSRLDLRNGKEAIQFAGKAAELANYRVPDFIATLAAAEALDGQFYQAFNAARIAAILASISGQDKMQAGYNQLAGLYISGKTADAFKPVK
jgi:4-amino-4-deoxy-L-arabinose transferase-like glycosyltransferase